MRTETEIIAAMDATLATIDAANRPTSTSDVGFFVTLKRMWALLVQDVERRLALLLTDVRAAVDSRPVGSLAWYVARIRAFQFGDAVGVYDQGTVGYALVDPAKQIVQQASCTEDGGGRLLVKVAKAGANGLLSPLTDAELDALRAYIAQVKFAGVAIDTVSRAADELKLAATVKLDTQLITATGISLADGASKPVEVAVQAYLRALPFNSILSWTGLTDYMQMVPGVLDFVVSSTAIRPAGGSTLTPFERQVDSFAGHMILVESTFTYVA